MLHKGLLSTHRHTATSRRLCKRCGHSRTQCAQMRLMWCVTLCTVSVKMELVRPVETDSLDTCTYSQPVNHTFQDVWTHVPNGGRGRGRRRRGWGGKTKIWIRADERNWVLTSSNLTATSIKYLVLAPCSEGQEQKKPKQNKKELLPSHFAQKELIFYNTPHR